MTWASNPGLNEGGKLGINDYKKVTYITKNSVNYNRPVR